MNDEYEVKVISERPMDSACTICLSAGSQPYVDAGPADDICWSCAVKIAQAVNAGVGHDHHEELAKQAKRRGRPRKQPVAA